MNDGARSYKTEIVGSDSFSITLNFKFLLNALAIFGSLIYAWNSVENRISDLELKMQSANNQLENLIKQHEKESEEEMKALSEELKWYKTMNPFNRKKK